MKILIVAVVFGMTDAFMDIDIAEKLLVQTISMANFALQIETRRQLFQDVTFHLYTKNNPKSTQLYLNDRETLMQSSFNSNVSTVIVIHGFTDHKERDLIVNLRDSFLNNTDSNVIVLDWQPLAALLYFKAATSAIQVGHYLKLFLLFLEDCNVDLKTVHLVGHSLGAQISGIAGGDLNGRIGRITALDPAGPLFETVYERNKTESLDHTDALFVDVIHTAGTTFGVMKPIGHVDFYPNHGTVPQPGCSNIILTVSCSHIRSVDYFIESFDYFNSTKGFLAKKCHNFSKNTLTNCTRALIPMGYYVPKESMDKVEKDIVAVFIAGVNV